MHYPTKEAEYEALLRSILTARSREGATVEEIRNDFQDMIGEVPEVFSEPFDTIQQYLESVPGVFYALEQSTYLWYCRTASTRHLTQLIEQQKSPRNGGRQASQGRHWQQQQQQQPMSSATYWQQQHPAYAQPPAYRQRRSFQHRTARVQPYADYPPPQRSSFYGSSSSCFFRDNDQYRLNARRSGQFGQFGDQHATLSTRSRSSSSLNSASSGGGGTGTGRVSGGSGSSTSGFGIGFASGVRNRFNALVAADHLPAYLYEFQLIGDDFLLALALTDLDATLVRDGKRTKRSGLCISGQTIRDAAQRVEHLMTHINEHVIVNLGSVDLLHGHEFADMKSDFLHLMEAFAVRHIAPVITTLAPLANLLHHEETRKRTEIFNAFLRTTFPEQVIDIGECFRSGNGGPTLLDCYQPLAKYMSGTCQPHTLWNRLGRQRVLGLLKRKVYEVYAVDRWVR